MSILEPLAAVTRRCETNVIAIDGSRLTCGAGSEVNCGLGIPEQRRAIMNRRRVSAQGERLAASDEWQEAVWWC